MDAASASVMCELGISRIRFTMFVQSCAEDSDLDAGRSSEWHVPHFARNRRKPSCIFGGISFVKRGRSGTSWLYACAGQGCVCPPLPNTLPSLLRIVLPLCSCAAIQLLRLKTITQRAAQILNLNVCLAMASLPAKS